jgi:hypothetical protein
MLAKASSPSYCLLPGLIAAAALIRGRVDGAAPGRWRLLAHCAFLLLSLGLLAETVAWYRKNGAEVRANAYEVSLGWVSLYYGHKDTFLNKFAFWVSSVREGLFIPYSFHAALLLTFAGLVGVAYRRWSKGDTLFRRINLVAWAALAHVLIVLSMASLAIPEETRYLTPLLPSVAVLVVWSLAQLRRRALEIAVLGLVLFQWGWVHGITLGYCERAYTVWLIPVQRDPARLVEVQKLVARTSNDARAHNRHNIIGVELPWINFNTFNYFSAKNKLKTNHRTYYTSLGFAEADTAKALDRLDKFNVVYFISLDHIETVDYLNRVAQPVTEAVARDPHYVRQPDPTNLGVTLFLHEQ